VDGEALLDGAGRELDDLLAADLVDHRVAVLVELAALDQLAREVAAGALADDRDLGGDVDAGLEVVAGLAVGADALVAGAHAAHGVALPQQVGAGEAGEQHDPLLLALRRQPRAQLAQADDGLAVVVQLRRDPRRLEVAGGGEEHHLVALDGALQREALHRAPVGQELIERLRIDHRARDLVGADAAALLQDGDLQLQGLALGAAGGDRLVVGVDLRLEVKGAGEVGRTRTNEQDVDRHLIALHGPSLGRRLLTDPSRFGHPPSTAFPPT
jgi:hypothetical protein